MTQTTETGPAWNRGGGRPAASSGPAMPASQASERLPVPTRQRRPAFAALALVLILGGAAVSGLLVLRGNQRVSVLLVRAEVEPGHLFQATDFTETQLSYTGDVAPVRYSQLGALLDKKYRASARIPAGSLLTFNMITNKIEVPGENFASVGVAVAPGLFPDGVRPGDAVKVLYTPKATNSGAVSGALAALAPGTTLVDKAFVKSAAQAAGSSGAGLQLTLVVPNEELTSASRQGLPLIAAANAVGAITVVQLPDNTKTDTGAGQ